MKILIAILTVLFASCVHADESFKFSESEKQWQFYGEGLGGYVSNEGIGEPKNSLWLSGELESTKTAFFEWTNLKPGKYTVSFYIKSRDVLPNRDQTSFWSFFDSGKGTEDIFRDLNGTYDWRKVEKVIEVKGSKLTFWFRLKTSGDVWIDQFELISTPAALVKEASIAAARMIALPKSVPVNIPAQKTGIRTVLFNFESDEYGHPFTRRNDKGEFLAQTYYDFNISKLQIKDWSAYDHIEMEVFNPNSEFVEFFFTVADENSQNYWGQLNHKQTLSPGWNKLNFALNQFVGERGSHRYFRSLNLRKLKKIYVVIDPDKKGNIEKKRFLIDNIVLTSNPMPVANKELHFFNFTGHKANLKSNYTKVLTSTSYNNQRGFGFVTPDFWRVEDSVYASELERYTIGLKSGKFRVDLPNGAYQIQLNIDKLGYWDVPFWSNRTVFANGEPIYKATRSTNIEMLKDILRFESVVPTRNDHPYDLYLSKVFETITKDVQVKNGYLELSFEGDASAISLNTLLIYKKASTEIATRFKNEINTRNKLEFDWMSRAINNSSTNETKNPVSLVRESLFLSPSSLESEEKSEISWVGGKDENLFKFIQIKAQDLDEEIRWEIESLKDSTGQVIDAKKISVEEVVFQFNSPDLNHETYILTGKFLRPTVNNKLNLNKKENKFLFLKLKTDSSMRSGKYTGMASFTLNRRSFKFPINLNLLNYTLKNPLDFPVGFFGIDPIPYSYFEKDNFEETRQKFRMKTIEKLLKAGFTTFTGLPQNEKHLEQIFNYTKAYGVKEVFTYGGSLFQDMDAILEGSDEIKLREKSIHYKKLLSNPKWPKIVYTFSDEAGGYSDKTKADIEKAKKLKRQFPFIELGGFGSFHTPESFELNRFFKVGFYSSMDSKGFSSIKNSHNRWGGYNGAAGNLDDPRATLGPLLFFAKKEGLTHYLEWHATGFNNYPYYDFDGREADVALFYPQTNGTLYNSIRFELAQEGIESFKKLIILEKRIKRAKGSKASDDAQKWLDGIQKNFVLLSDKNFMTKKNFDYKSFKIELNTHLERLF